MIEILIDGQPVEASADCSVVLSASLSELTTPETLRPKRHELTLAMTPQNRAVLGFPEQAFSPRRFKQEEHWGTIRCAEATLVEGNVELVRCENDPAEGGRYLLALVVPTPHWVGQATQKLLGETEIEYEGVLNAAQIQSSWTADSPVRFLPVKRDQYPAYGETQSVISQLGYENYYPFVQVKALFEAIVQSAGYRIESSFLNEPFFGTLYMSGRYDQTGNNGSIARMDFIAGNTFPDRTATADSTGRVYTTAPAGTHSVGTPVDTAILSTEYTSTLSERAPSFQLIDGRPAFVPEEAVIVGFEFQMKVQLAGQVVSESEEPFRLMWGEETLYEAELEEANPLTDLKNTGGVAGAYRVVVSDETVVNRRIAVYRANGSSTYLYFTNPNSLLNIPNDFTRVTCFQMQGYSYVQIQNWALYSNEEYVEFETGSSQELALKVRSQPLLRPKDEAVFFDTLVFEGLPAGSVLTYCFGTLIKPVFYSMPEPGSLVTFASLFAHQTTQMEFIEAITHLFGLHFYTDELTKTLYIEPRFTFLEANSVTDWTAKINPKQPIEWEEFGGDRHERERWGYRSGDAATERASGEGGMPYGAWEAEVLNRYGLSGRATYPNPLFTATIDRTQALSSAPAASMIVVGDRDQREGVSNFPAKIVRYLGMKPLPAGQRWGWPTYANQYPLVMFHSKNEDWFTLCFDDYQEQLGLKNYHQPMYDTINNGRKLSLHLRLSPSDMEAILSPNSTHCDFRGNFVFWIRGEKIRGRLLEITGYNPVQGDSARCVFAVEDIS
ncbi:MAG: hypothetical protein LBM20_04065 [Rikenellaceae bacterium]|jgi:hypothetical protein|nr:hypothetical protein [Rikenellaceae bacterium]